MRPPHLGAKCALLLAGLLGACSSEPTAPLDAGRDAVSGVHNGGASGGGDAGTGGSFGGGTGGNAGVLDARLDEDRVSHDSSPFDAGGDGTGGDAPMETAPDPASWAGCGAEAVVLPLIKGPAANDTDADQTFRSLVVSPADANVAFVGSEGNGMFRTVNGGMSWTWLRAGLRHDGHTAYAETWDLAISAAKPSRLYAAMTDSPGPVAGPYPSARGGLYRSDDDGETWRQMGCGLPNAKTAAVWTDPTNADVVIAALEGGEPSFGKPWPQAYYAGGLWKSNDGGKTFVALQLPPGHERNSYWRVAKRGAKFWTVGLDGRETPDKGLGFLASADGMTFTALAMPFAGKIVAGWDVTPDGMTIVASVRDTFQMQRSVDGGATFAAIAGIASANANGPIAISPHDAKVVLFGSNQRLHRSEDGLATSAPVLEAPAFVEDIEYAPSNPYVVYATVRGLRVFKSGDAGKTWTPVGNLRADVIEKN
ncbi:MAG TPA: hypothetical protein VGG33_02260 [Polyangia bacterium]